MAKRSDGQYDRLVTLRVVAKGDPQHWDWEQIVKPGPKERVEIVKVEDVHANSE